MAMEESELLKASKIPSVKGMSVTVCFEGHASACLDGIVAHWTDPSSKGSSPRMIVMRAITAVQDSG